MVRPCLCVIAQGSKEVYLGESSYRYDSHQYFLVTAGLPLIGHVLQASRGQPYLSLRLLLDRMVVSAAIVEAGHNAPRSRGDVQAIDVSPLSTYLLDAVVRLVRLLGTPAKVPVLTPMITREIVYRPLMGDQSARLRHIAVLDGHRHRIIQAVKRIQDNYNQSIPIERLAEEHGMNVLGFHRHFKAVTGMTPLKFQKQLQLQEARRLMLSEDIEWATTMPRILTESTNGSSVGRRCAT